MEIRMIRRDKEKNYQKAIQKEWKALQKRESRIEVVFEKEQNGTGWRQMLESKVPDKIRTNLEKAFCVAFTTVFEKGTGIIEKSYDRQKILDNVQIQNYAFQVKADRKSLKQVRNGVAHKNLGNIAATAVEGVGLGVLGIGLPDIVIFTGVLLRGVYEVSLHYGFDYDTEEERYFILKLMETAMRSGEAWKAGNGEIDRLIIEMAEEEAYPGPAAYATKEDVAEQIRNTSDAFAADMLILKFVQGIPIVGILGGCGNPVYYNKVMKYAQMKYQRRYLYRLGAANCPYGM